MSVISSLLISSCPGYWRMGSGPKPVNTGEDDGCLAAGPVMLGTLMETYLEKPCRCVRRRQKMLEISVEMPSCVDWMWKLLNCHNTHRDTTRLQYGSCHDCDVLSHSWICHDSRSFMLFLLEHIRDEHDKLVTKRQPLGVNCALLESFVLQVGPTVAGVKKVFF